MKYKFEKIDSDTTKLTYKDKEFEIKRDVDLTKRMQGLYMKARTNMLIELAKQGISKKDLTIEHKENGKTYYDNTNVTELENVYIQMASLELYNELSKKYTGMDFQDLITDVGIDDKEAEDFGVGFTKALQGDDKTPSSKE